MSEPGRATDTADGAPVGSGDRDRSSRIEQLLLAGLDQYFSGRYEEAVDIWTRVAFLERRNGRARAYIERARGALAERQRASDELVAAARTALDSGESVDRAACAACHGLDGRGAPQLTVGFDVPLPDFTDCSFSSREPAADWFAISHDGGPARAFDRRMPAFGQALAAAQIEMAVARIKRFCDDPSWPAGELNLPRALVTEKAFPEDEAVLSTTVAAGTFVNEFLYERRIGARTQYEVKVPVAVQEGDAGWRRGLGDVAIAIKHAFHHTDRLNSGIIANFPPLIWF